MGEGRGGTLRREGQLRVMPAARQVRGDGLRSDKPYTTTVLPLERTVKYEKSTNFTKRTGFFYGEVAVCF